MEKNNSMISLYDGTKKKLNMDKNNSNAYIKKRPNDLIKSHNLNRSTIVSKYSNSSSKENGRCFSCINIKNKANIFTNSKLKRNISFYKDNLTSTKEAPFQKVNPFVINDFSFKDKDDFMNRKILFQLIEIIQKIVKKRLIAIKALFFQNMQKRMKMKGYKVSLDDYKFLEELKALGVNNKKDLNLLLKDIYSEIKAKN